MSSSVPQISIVDDEPSVGRAIQSLLRSLGYAANSFASAEEFLKSSVRRNTTCLILDLHMPGMSGLQLQARLAAEGDCVPIIFVSGAADEGIKKRALQAGAHGFLSKPVDYNALLGLLHKHCPC
jgi:FixJ family two-component response regulator